MKFGFARTSIDIPQDVHRRLHEPAILAGPVRRLKLDPTLIQPAGVTSTSQMIRFNELIELP